MARTLAPSTTLLNEFRDKVYIGIDNGVSGTIGMINAMGTRVDFIHTPTFSCLSYTKKAQNITRIDTGALLALLEPEDAPIVLLERPMVNPGRFKATMSALRALEATLIVLEKLKLPFRYVDSKEWQKELLPSGIKGAENLKRASVDVGCRLFPYFHDAIHKHKDADGLLIAEWARRNQL